jgi:esterase/lipase superfamily enzyme
MQTMLKLNLRRGDSAFRFAPMPSWSHVDGPPIALDDARRLVSGKRVLVLVHGYRVADAFDAYARIAAHVGSRYDVVIGVSWPGSKLILGFPWAINRADKAGLLLAAALKQINPQFIDIEGHSLGCRVALETVRLGVPVRDVILAAAAVDDESIEIGERYGEALAGVRNVLVAYSRHDEALLFGYRFSQWDTALGLGGPCLGAWLPACVRTADLSSTITSHGSYKRDARFFAAWEALS